MGQGDSQYQFNSNRKNRCCSGGMDGVERAFLCVLKGWAPMLLLQK